ncbi:MAG TPA: DUF2147 domain-containing protein [Cyclobacteriaceae bacterium]|nr:DUF2147 domain-containing protein [Cyclobacteriaceae bacterium]
MKLSLLILCGLLPILARGQSTIVGKWKSVDDNAGDVRSIVEVYETAGVYFGKITKIFPRPTELPDPVCDKCDPTDPRHNAKVVGMVIIRGLRKSGDEYTGGDILDPEVGKVYRAKLWLDGKELKVRGYWGPFYRTQTWLRAD